MFNYDYLTATKKVYSETNLMNVTQTHMYNTCILIRKIINKSIHVNINFTEKRHHQKMKLRNANDLILRKPRTNYGRKCILYEGAQLFNKLPENIKQAKSIGIFKARLKNYIQAKATR